MKAYTHDTFKKKNGCNVCNYWSVLTGCAHHGPGFDTENKLIRKEIVKATHGGNPDIVETSDFMQGVNAALIFLRENNLIKKHPKS